MFHPRQSYYSLHVGGWLEGEGGGVVSHTVRYGGMGTKNLIFRQLFWQPLRIVVAGEQEFIHGLI